MAKEFIFEEYKLDNDLHVILHQDNSAPVVTIGVMYHVRALRTSLSTFSLKEHSI